MLTEWKRHNPYRLIDRLGNVKEKFTELEDALRHLALAGLHFLGVSGTQVFYN